MADQAGLDALDPFGVSREDGIEQRPDGRDVPWCRVVAEDGAKVDVAARPSSAHVRIEQGND